MTNIFPIEQNTQSKGMRDYCMVIFKYKVLITTVFAVTAGIVALVAFLLPTVYVAKSSILVKIGREYLNNADVGEGKKLLSVNNPDIVNAEIQILTNRELAEKVVKAVKVENLYPGLVRKYSSNDTAQAKAVDKFQKNLLVEAIRNSSVIQVSFQHNDPRVAIAAVNQLVEFYKEKHLQVFSNPTSMFIDQQLTAYAGQLKASEKNFEQFKQQNRVFSLDEQRSLLLQQRMNLDSSLKDAQNKVDELSKKLASFTRQNQYVATDKSLNTPSDQDGVLVDTKAKLLALQLEEQQLLKKFKASSRTVLNIHKEIELVQQFLKGQEEEFKGKANAGNTVVQQVRMELIKTEADLSSQKARVAILKAQLSQTDREVEALDRNAQEFQNLKREVANTEKNYQTYLIKSEEARLSENMNQQKMVNLSVIQPAVVPSEPLSKKKFLIIIFGLLGGLGLSLGSAFFLDNLSQGLNTPERTEKCLGLPVLASISYCERS